MKTVKKRSAARAALYAIFTLILLTAILETGAFVCGKITGKWQGVFGVGAVTANEETVLTVQAKEYAAGDSVAYYAETDGTTELRIGTVEAAGTVGITADGTEVAIADVLGRTVNLPDMNNAQLNKIFGGAVKWMLGEQSLYAWWGIVVFILLLRLLAALAGAGTRRNLAKKIVRGETALYNARAFKKNAYTAIKPSERERLYGKSGGTELALDLLCTGRPCKSNPDPAAALFAGKRCTVGDAAALLYAREDYGEVSEAEYLLSLPDRKTKYDGYNSAADVYRRHRNRRIALWGFAIGAMLLFGAGIFAELWLGRFDRISLYEKLIVIGVPALALLVALFATLLTAGKLQAVEKYFAKTVNLPAHYNVFEFGGTLTDEEIMSDLAKICAGQPTAEDEADDWYDEDSEEPDDDEDEAADDVGDDTSERPSDTPRIAEPVAAERKPDMPEPERAEDFETLVLERLDALIAAVQPPKAEYPVTNADAADVDAQADDTVAAGDTAADAESGNVDDIAASAEFDGSEDTESADMADGEPETEASADTLGMIAEIGALLTDFSDKTTDTSVDTDAKSEVAAGAGISGETERAAGMPTEELNEQLRRLSERYGEQAVWAAAVNRFAAEEQIAAPGADSTVAAFTVTKKLSYTEALAALPEEQQDYRDALISFAETIAKARYKSTNSGERVVSGKYLLIGLQVRRGALTASFEPETEALRQLRAEQKGKLKVNPTLLRVTDEEAFEAAQRMIRLQAENVERAKEERRAAQREARRRKRLQAQAAVQTTAENAE